MHSPQSLIYNIGIHIHQAAGFNSAFFFVRSMRSTSIPSASLIFASSIFLLIAGPAAAQKAATQEAEKQTVDFAREVLPILSDKCFLCHGPDAYDKDLVRLDSFEGATKDLGGYLAVNPNTPTESALLDRIHSVDDPMPPVDAEKQMTESEREILSKWIAGGGSYAKHWAFVKPTRSQGPEAPRNIDGFIEREFSAANIKFAPKADKATLARRAAFTLTGLPPEPEVLAAFMKDGSPEAYETYLEKLFTSPRYGEHQARFWLDAVRYGDTHGLHLDNRRGIYPYRDWVVRAMNRNLPLNDFILWQLAGDLLPDPALEQYVATGFVRMNPSTSEGGAIAAEFQAKNNFDRTETLGTVLLGMTLTCARCHTHKYDPITQTEYYQMLAFFNSTEEGAMDGNRYEYGTTARAPKDQAGWQEAFVLGLKRAKMLRAAEKKFGKKLAEKPSDWEQLSRSAKAARLADPRGTFRDTLLQIKAEKIAKAQSDLESTYTTTLIVKDLSSPRETKLLQRGEYDKPLGDPLLPGVPEVIGTLPEGAPRNRLGLARWLISSEHPLTSRVLVNRIWQRVFGYGLVRSPEDFGLQGQQPTHPELLDWLALELQSSGWDLQHMLKLMMTSQTFRQSSAWRAELDDPENKLFARGPSYRMDAEVIRDTALWASNLLDPHMGGEGVKPYQPVGMWKALAHPASNTKQYVQDKGDLLYRRSLYIYWKRTSPHPMMTLFDAPDREASCVRRSRTNTSLQSLGLLNETQRIEMGRKFAERLLMAESKDDRRITRMFELLACRSPNAKEREACNELLRQMRRRYKEAKEDATKLVSMGEAKRNEKLAVEELAAWTQVCVTILASDIAIRLY
ncbi:MAG: PSD1 and planctomycete cytochrome C domain-containing protein [Planctomycetota bacterium]|nr:PSD1 and planctomycete cytochrome C domain-containing protein [Planctomycetota bacterium]